MEVCHSSPSANMSFLDQLFGTDGRKHKNEGIWNWVKSQKKKTKSKSKHQMLTRPLTLASATPKPMPSHCGSIHSSTSTAYGSDTSSRARSLMSFTCSPTFPTSSFTPAPAHPIFPDAHTPHTRATDSSSSSAKRSSSSSWSSSSSSATKTPYMSSRQRAESTLNLPTQPTSTPRQVYQLPHQNYSYIEGPIKRSTSSRSAPAHFNLSNTSQESLEGHSNRHIKGKGALMDHISETTAGTGPAIGNTPIGNLSQRRDRTSSGDFSYHQRQHSSETDRAQRAEDGWWWE